MKPAEPRQFNYQFRYYKPDDEDQKKIQFRRIRKSNPPQKVSSLRITVILVIVVVIAFLLFRKAPDFFTPSQDNVTLEEIQVVE